MTDHADAAWLAELAARPRNVAVAAALRDLAARGLRDPAVAGGFVRQQLFGAPPTDVDIHYVGAVPTTTAEGWLAETRAARDLGGEWDIWNFQECDPRVTTTAYGYRIHFVSTIDSVALDATGRLHDLTGRGLADARDRTLSLTLLDHPEYPYAAGQLCYLCLEGCRRMYLHDLAPTPASAAALRQHSQQWSLATAEDRAYLRARLREKLTATQRAAARSGYAAYGWDAVFADGDA